MPPTVSGDTTRLYETLPEYARESDAEQPDVPGVQPQGYPLLSWLEGIGSQLQAIDDICRDTPEGPGYSQLLDVTRCPTAFLPWLAQLVGLRFTGKQLASDSLMRAGIEAPGNFARGAPSALMGAITPLLTSAAGVVIEERTPNPYAVTINIPSDDTTAITYAELAASYPTYDDVAAAFPTYDDFPDNQDNITAAAVAAAPAALTVVVNFT